MVSFLFSNAYKTYPFHRHWTYFNGLVQKFNVSTNNRRIYDMMILDKALENIQQLQNELQKINLSIQNEIVSVIIDGSIIRGDFIEDSSDIDMTITTLYKKCRFTD